MSNRAIERVNPVATAVDATIVDPIGQKTMAESVSVTIASDQTPALATETTLNSVLGVLTTIRNQQSPVATYAAEQVMWREFAEPPWPNPWNLIIDGYPADFASMAGGEQVTCAYMGVPWTTIMTAAETTAAAVAARIAAFGPFGLTIVPWGGGVRILVPSNPMFGTLEVQAISQLDFLKIGLPIITRDVLNGSVTTVAVDCNDPFVSGGDRTDHISQPIGVDPRANRVSLIASITNSDPDVDVGVTVGVGFSDGAWGNRSDIFNPIYQSVYDAALSGNDGFAGRGLYGALHNFTPVPYGKTLNRAWPTEGLAIPMGMTSMYIVAFSQYTGTPGVYARIPPLLSMRAQFFSV